MKLNIQEQRAKAFDYLFDAVVVTDVEGTIVDWNKGSELLYGYTKEEVLGQSVSILHVPEDVEHVTAEVLSSVEKDGKWSGEVRMLHKNGNIGWIESMCIPILDEDQQMIGALGINRDISARIEESERVLHLAHYDQLTEIPNRHLLMERVSQAIKHAKRDETKFTLLFIDLDKFKVINDTKGHSFGDMILKEAASRFARMVRKSDTLARIGGDEFVLLLENMGNKKSISNMAKALNKKVSQPFVVDGESFNLSCSIGVAIYPDNGTTASELLSAADQAMYQAKDDGRATHSF